MPKDKKFPYTAKGKADAAESKRQRAMRPKAKKEPTAAQRRQKKASQSVGLRKYTDRDETNVKRTVFEAKERAKTARMNNKKK
jgi:hypothetical protein